MLVSSMVPSPVLTLSHGLHTMTIAPSAGGRILRFYTKQAEGIDHDWLMPIGPSPWQNNAWPKGGCYPLVPFSNRIRDAQFMTPDGSDVRLKTFPGMRHALHGFGHYAPWQTLHHDTDTLLMHYKHASGSSGWPWAFEVTQSIHLNDDGAQLGMQVRNESPQPMPLGFGFHPYFAAASARLQAQTQWRHEAEIATEPMPGTPANRYDRDVDGYTCYVSEWDGHARLFYGEDDHPLVLKLSADHLLSHLVVHAAPNKAYLCLEPVSHVSDAFNLAAMGWPGTGIQWLAAGESLAATIKLEPET